MAANVLDKSGWSQDALDRVASHEAAKAAHKALLAARAAHPLAGVLEGLTDASRAVSESERWRLKVADFGNGHKEAVVWRVCPDLERDLDRAIERDLPARGESVDREANIERAVRRAKQKVRYLAKSAQVNSLWTLTYRANQTDRDLCLRHFDLFRRRVAKALGEFVYVTVLEKQTRGAWHVHIATHGLPARVWRDGVPIKSWDFMRRAWRGVVGELGGNFDEAKRRWGGRVRGSANIARYIAGYCAKDMLESGLNRKRYSCSKGIAEPEVCRAEWAKGVHLAELIELAYAAVGDRITARWFDADRGIFFVESDDTG